MLVLSKLECKLAGQPVNLVMVWHIVFRYWNLVNESSCHLALSVALTTSGSGPRQLRAESAAIVAPAVASEQQPIQLASQPLDIAILEPNGSPNFHYLIIARFASDLGAVFLRALTGGIATFGHKTTSFPSPAVARMISATFNPPVTSVTPANAMAELRNPKCLTKSTAKRASMHATPLRHDALALLLPDSDAAAGRSRVHDRPQCRRVS